MLLPAPNLRHPVLQSVIDAESPFVRLSALSNPPSGSFFSSLKWFGNPVNSLCKQAAPIAARQIMAMVPSARSSQIYKGLGAAVSLSLQVFPLITGLSAVLINRTNDQFTIYLCGRPLISPRRFITAIVLLDLLGKAQNRDSQFIGPFLQPTLLIAALAFNIAPNLIPLLLDNQFVTPRGWIQRTSHLTNVTQELARQATMHPRRYSLIQSSLAALVYGMMTTYQIQSSLDQDPSTMASLALNHTGGLAEKLIKNIALTLLTTAFMPEQMGNLYNDASKILQLLRQTQRVSLAVQDTVQTVPGVLAAATQHHEVAAYIPGGLFGRFLAFGATYMGANQGLNLLEQRLTTEVDHLQERVTTKITTKLLELTLKVAIAAASTALFNQALCQVLPEHAMLSTVLTLMGSWATYTLLLGQFYQSYANLHVEQQNEQNYADDILDLFENFLGPHALGYFQRFADMAPVAGRAFVGEIAGRLQANFNTALATTEVIRDEQTRRRIRIRSQT